MCHLETKKHHGIVRVVGLGKMIQEGTFIDDQMHGLNLTYHEKTVEVQFMRKGRNVCGFLFDATNFKIVRGLNGEDKSLMAHLSPDHWNAEVSNPRNYATFMADQEAELNPQRNRLLGRLFS